jgi:hypothetical protein
MPHAAIAIAPFGAGLAGGYNCAVGIPSKPLRGREQSRQSRDGYCRDGKSLCASRHISNTAEIQANRFVRTSARLISLSISWRPPS